MKSYKLVYVFLLTVILNGCGLMQIQSPIAQFSTGVHSLATSEMNFFKAVQTMDCVTGFYTQAFEYSNGNGTTFDISGKCNPILLTDDQIKIRQTLMDTLTLYADKMKVLATNDDTALDSEMVGDISNTIKTYKTQTLNSEITTGIKVAMIAITDMILDHKKFTEVKSSATAMQPYLETIVKDLKSENSSLAQNIDSKMDKVEINLRWIISKSHENKSNMSFFDIMQSRKILQSINPFGERLISQTNFDLTTSDNAAEQMNNTLDAILVANKAIANANTADILPSINNLISISKNALKATTPSK
jgi:hypothetical protein